MKKSLLTLAFALLGCAGAAQATPSAFGLIGDNTTYATDSAFRFTNNSTAGESIVKLVWDLTPIAAFFDTTNANPGNSSSGLDPQGFSGSGVGLYGYIGDVAQNGLTTLTLLFNSFGAGESFIFGIDTDLFSNIDGYGLVGSQFIGATATAYFSNGAVRTGTYTATNLNGYGSQASITSAVPEPGSMALAGLALAGLATLRRRTAPQA